MRMILLTLSLALFAFSIKGIELQINTTTINSTLDNGMKAYYNVTIPAATQLDKFYLIFDLIPSGNDESDPDIFISSVSL